MGRISNETKLVLKVSLERMEAKKLDWNRRATNPNANSNDPAWLAGYEYAWKEWNDTLVDVIFIVAI